MENKRYLKKFNSKSDYKSQKDYIMGMPHVVLLGDTEEVIYASKNNEDEIDYASEYFTIEALENGTVGIGMPSSAISLKYRKNKEYWIETSEAIQVSVVANDTIQISCVSDSFKGDDSSIFAISIPFNVKGNIMSLLCGDNFEEQIDLGGKDFVFSSLFKNCTTLQNAENLIFPATTLTNYCYIWMFQGCTSLTTAPIELPATTLTESCYQFMFSGCTSLTSAPQLPATTLALNCYQYMFQGCTSLITAPELSATTLADFCYNGMFDSCTSLIEAPELPATTLASGCYAMMFNGCTSLIEAPELLATTLASSCYTMMFAYCTSLKKAPELSATTLTDFCYMAMFASCTSLQIAPELPATTLVDFCYNAMFDSCSNLNYIMMLATDISASKCLTDWVNGVASSGTFVKNYYTNLENGSSGIPNKWILLNIKDNITCGIFYIDLFIGKEKFDFELEMTWEKWVNSEYNTIHAYIENENIYVGGGLIIKEFDQGVVKAKDKIMTNGSYVQITQ